MFAPTAAVLFYPVPTIFSTILHRFYKTDTNQPRCGTGTGEPMAGRQRQGLRADIAQDTAAAHAKRDEAVVDTRVRQPEKIGVEGGLHRRAALAAEPSTML